jgi:hypothetical protein
MTQYPGRKSRDLGKRNGLSSALRYDPDLERMFRMRSRNRITEPFPTRRAECVQFLMIQKKVLRV